MRRLALLGAVVLAAGCGPGTQKQGTPGADASRGKQLIVQYGCGACHRIGGVSGADGAVGPALTKSVLGSAPSGLAKFIQDPPRYIPDGTMPDLGVSAADAKDIVAYLESHA